MVPINNIWRVKANRRLALVLSSPLCAGCSSRPKAVEMPGFNPSKAAAKAIEDYDKDGDGKLSDAELKSIPGMFKWKQLYDLDSDGYVSQDEISNRLKKWRADNVAFRFLGAQVTLDGRPLPNAHIVMTPESYLGDSGKVATGTTNERGFASMIVAAEDLPAAIKQRGIKVSGVYLGTYKISVTHPQRELPSVDDKGLQLGDEVARDTVDTSVDYLAFVGTLRPNSACRVACYFEVSPSIRSPLRRWISGSIS